MVIFVCLRKNSCSCIMNLLESVYLHTEDSYHYPALNWKSHGWGFQQFLFKDLSNVWKPLVAQLDDIGYGWKVMCWSNVTPRLWAHTEGMVLQAPTWTDSNNNFDSLPGRRYHIPRLIIKLKIVFMHPCMLQQQNELLSQILCICVRQQHTYVANLWFGNWTF